MVHTTHRRSDDRPDVALASTTACYEARPPYCPWSAYPEYRFPETASSCGPNGAYDAVRRCFELLGLDAERLGTRDWNPLGSFIQPGDKVVLKPNFVRHFRETHAGHGDCLITHGAVLRAVCDYAYIALGGEGRLIIADAPHNDADFDAVRQIACTADIQSFYRKHAGFSIEVLDLRPECAEKIDGVIVGHVPLAGDPEGYAKVNLGLQSAFAEINGLCHLLYGSEYDTRELHRHQHDDVHEYLISKTVLSADCVIGIPKLKTHKKTGITVNMKNLVGINGNKNWLPHHREGTPAQGGDQFADDAILRRVERKTVAGFKRLFPFLGPLRPYVAGPIKAVGKRIFGDTNVDTIRSGNWHGNDTTWRMATDLNRILFFADADGALHDKPVRKFFSVVDGIVAGEGNGPLDPTPKPLGAVLAGANPVAVDLACARLMGFDHRKIPLLARAFDPHPYGIAPRLYDQLRCASNADEWDGPLSDLTSTTPAFRPHYGWRGEIELCAGQDRAVIAESEARSV